MQIDVANQPSRSAMIQSSKPTRRRLGLVYVRLLPRLLVGAGVGFVILRASTGHALAWWLANGWTQDQWRGATQIAALLWGLATTHEASVSVFRRPYDDFWIGNERTDGRLVFCSLKVAWIAVATWAFSSVLFWGAELLGLILTLGKLGSVVPESVQSDPVIAGLTISALGLVAGYGALNVLFWDEYSVGNDPKNRVRLRMIVPDGVDRSWRGDVPRWVAEEERRAQVRADAERDAGAKADSERHHVEQERLARERLDQERERLRAELKHKEAERRARVEADTRRREQEEARAREEAKQRQEEEERTEKREAVAQAFAFLGLQPTISFQDVKDRFRRRALELHPDRNRDRVKWATGEMATLNLHMDTLRRFFRENESS
jgi:hypothetical protein